MMNSASAFDSASGAVGEDRRLGEYRLKELLGEDRV